MPDLSAPVKLGANCWNQYTDWPAWLAAEQRASELGYDSLWTWDHVYPIVGSPHGPMFEAYTSIAALAATTTRGTIGLMVGANTFRNPALVAKMITTIDHISGGRAVLGIGGAWFETEHQAFGFEFGSGFPERLRWLGEALPVMRGMLDGAQPTATGPRYAATDVRNDPPPIQAHVPILIGGSGREVTLKLVARYGDANNVGGTVDNVRDADATLIRHCEAIGRDEREIERTTGTGTVVIRDSRAEAQRVFEAMFERNGNARLWENQPVGTPEDVVERLAPYVELGYRHLIAGFPSPYDEESMTRFATEIRPKLQRLVSGA
jgi:alkanesulfonate monooxygenase SsuD/methylene tetrahydromethanopterin reductase-like flavin-dependent oxidoreductase (luciferase family)